MQFPARKQGLILLTAITALLIPAILLEMQLVRHTGGAVSYPVDSAFLNIGTAKTLAFYKVWGVSKYHFQSATASLLYPVALALVFFITGAHLVIPVILNAVLAIAFLYAIQRSLDRHQVSPQSQLAILIFVILITALPLLVVSGTECVLQLLLCFLFIETLAKALQTNNSKLPRSVYVYAMLAVATRYEDALLIILASILLISMNRRRQAFESLAIAVAPILAFGVISLLKGSDFLPTPLIMDEYSIYGVSLTVACFAASLLLIRRFHRAAVLAVMALPFIVQNITSLAHFERDSFRIYEQQYPLAGFVHRYYRMGTIGADDLAALAYFTDGRKLDYSGVISADIARSKRENSWNAATADSLSRKFGVATAILSDSFFDKGLPPRWFKIASWIMPDESPRATRTFTFYSFNRWDSLLQRRLHDYQPLLPTGISVHYY